MKHRPSKFKRTIENKTKLIYIQVNNAHREIIERNRVRLHTIIDTIITCGRQNIALQDNSQYYICEDVTNPGNFIEIVKYGGRCEDLDYELFKDCPSNQTYHSKTI
jgi:hypothetical protein